MTLYYNYDFYGEAEKTLIPPTKYVFKIVASPSNEDAKIWGILMNETQTKGRVFILRSESTTGPWRVLRNKNANGTYQNTYEYFGSSTDALERIEELKAEYKTEVVEYVSAKASEIREIHQRAITEEISMLNDWFFKIENEDGKIVE